jgi:hypothetical protein
MPSPTFSPTLLQALAQAVLAFHVAVILFNLFGLIAVPLGAWRRWRFVRIAWWRALHLASLAVVAGQALVGRACFLTLWQAGLSGAAGEEAVETPLIQRMVERMVFWALPAWIFVVLYVAIFLYAAALWRLVPPGKMVGQSARGT